MPKLSEWESLELLKEAFSSMSPGDQASYVLDVAHYGRGFMRWTDDKGYVYVSAREILNETPRHP